MQNKIGEFFEELLFWHSRSPELHRLAGAAECGDTGAACALWDLVSEEYYDWPEGLARAGRLWMASVALERFRDGLYKRRGLGPTLGFLDRHRADAATMDLLLRRGGSIDRRWLLYEPIQITSGYYVKAALMMKTQVLESS